MNITIALANNKGGCGKTTTAQHLAIALAAFGHPTLLVDLDGQANLTAAMLGDKLSPNLASIANVFRHSAALTTVMISSGLPPGVALIPATGELDEVADDMVIKPLAVLRLRNALALHYAHAIDAGKPTFTLLDCPPNLGALTFSALVAADHVIAPTKPEEWALVGITRIQSKLDEIKQELGQAPAILGTIATQVRDTKDHRTHLGLLRRGHMPRLLGVVPLAGGLDADARLRAAYAGVAGAMLARLGIGFPRKTETEKLIEEL